MHMLCLFFSVFGEFLAPPICLEYKLKRIEWLTMDPSGRKYSWNNAKEAGGEKDCLVCVDIGSIDLGVNAEFTHSHTHKSRS